MINTKFNDKEFTAMLRELELAPQIYHPSSYWQDLNTKHTKHIAIYGMKYFKRSLNKDYFDWGPTGIVPYQLSPLFFEIRKGNFFPFMQSKFIENKQLWKPFYKFQFLSKQIYRIHVAYMYDYVSRVDYLGILRKVTEPRFGSPLLIGYRNRIISQDVCNSTQEFYSIVQEVNITKKLELIELGAGYGRVAYIFLKILPKVNYCIVDIPPALYISQEYLRKIFPREKFFFYRQFNSFKEVEKDFLNARIRFLLPHQIEYLPKASFDIFVNISSFHEMRKDQVENYIKQADRICRGFFYFKQWKKANARDNNNIKENEYPIPAKWQKIYHHTDPIHSSFFEALWKTRSNKL